MSAHAIESRQEGHWPKTLGYRADPADDGATAASRLPDFASIIEHAPDAMLLIDAAGSIAYANECVRSLFGFETMWLVGLPFEQLVPVGPQGGLPGAPGGEHTRLTGRRPDGTPFPIDVRFSSLACGTDHWALAVIRDASEQVRELDEAHAAKRTAEQLARLRSEFLGVVAHDLSQPVQTLELVISAIERTARHSADLAELSALATLSLARMREMLRMLLEISRLDSGALQVHEEPVPVAELFASIERQFGTTAGAKGLTLLTEASRHVVEADPALLRSMVSHLVANAIRYTQSGQVCLQTAVEADGKLSLVVRDSGIGIPNDQLQVIFQDFRRLDQARRMDGAGFGLGLGIVRRLSSLLGWPVTVQSEVGCGSAFLVEIPAGKVFSLA